jgi:hypothetical protein
MSGEAELNAFSDDEGAISLVGWMLLRTYPVPHFKLSILYDNVYYGVF